MASRKSLLAIGLTLALMFTPLSLGWAGGQASDEGDGHPWDDGTTGEPQPPQPDGSTTGFRPTAPVATTQSQRSYAASAVLPGGAVWVADALWSSWLRIMNIKTESRSSTANNRR